MSEPTRGQRPWRSIGSHWKQWLQQVIFVWRIAARGRTNRARVLAVLFAVGFALIGVARDLPWVSFIMQPPFNLDWALRTVALGWHSPSDTLPVTIVDIDEATYRSWQSPAITPRGELARLIETVTRAGPVAVVVDIDLSGGGVEAIANDDQCLAAFLAAYRGAAPLIFPKRIEPTVDGARHTVSSPYDALFVRQARLQWAHANFGTDGDGNVRHWAEWLAVCSNGEGQRLPAVPVRVVDSLAGADRGLARVAEPSESVDCLAQGSGNERRLLVGPRITGRSANPFARDARTVSAALVLDPEIARDDQGLFAGRVVLIGATHSASGDFWLTPGGVLPGVELLANAVHYAPLAPDDGLRSEIAYRALVLLLFGFFAWASWRLSGLLAFFGGIAFALLVVSIAIRGWDYFRVFESVETSIVLTVLYLGLWAFLNLIADAVGHWKSFPPGTDRFCRTVRAVCVQEDE